MENRSKMQVRILLEKQADSEKFGCEIEAESGKDLIHGIAMVVVKGAQALNVSIEKMVAMLATVLLAPDEGEG